MFEGLPSIQFTNGQGGSQYFSITVSSDVELKIAAQSVTAPTPQAIYARRNNFPTQTTYDASTILFANWSPTELDLNIPPSSFSLFGTNVWYIMVYGSNSASSSTTFTVTATTKSKIFHSFLLITVGGTYSALDYRGYTISATIGTLSYYTFSLASGDYMVMKINDAGKSSKVYLRANEPASSYNNDYTYDTATTSAINYQNNNPYSIVVYITVMPYNDNPPGSLTDSFTIGATDLIMNSNNAGAIVGIVLSIVACCCCCIIGIGVFFALLFYMGYLGGRFTTNTVVITDTQPTAVATSPSVTPV